MSYYERPEATSEARYPVCSASAVVDTVDVSHTAAGLKAQVHAQAREHGLEPVEAPHVDIEPITTVSGRDRRVVAVTLTCRPKESTS